MEMSFSENYVIYGRMVVMTLFYFHYRQMKQLYHRTRFCIKLDFDARDYDLIVLLYYV